MSMAIPAALLRAGIVACIVGLGSASAAELAPFKVPPDSAIPDGPTGDAIRRGRNLINDTHKQLPDNVGNGLTCSNCHLAGGTKESAGPYVGLWGVFPEYRSRDGRINALQERVNDCLYGVFGCLLKQ